ncbi:hypothetical protein GCK32_021194 [Trichostrongylus colubriformis]|uniref:Uncharacterized protein n=1 Tax=Trichostrongylus colubriformis TaxID=6319 RepID=A0AAN8FJS3_TRICO
MTICSGPYCSLFSSRPIISSYVDRRVKERLGTTVSVQERIHSTGIGGGRQPPPPPGAAAAIFTTMLRLARELKHQSISKRDDSSEEDQLHVERRRSARLNPKQEQVRSSYRKNFATILVLKRSRANTPAHQSNAFCLLGPIRLCGSAGSRCRPCSAQCISF